MLKKVIKTAIKAKISLCLIILVVSFCAAHDGLYNARTVALGGSITAGTGDSLEDFLSQNPAGLTKNPAGIFLYNDNQFGITGSNVSGLSLSFGKDKLRFGLTYHRNGIDLKEENSTGFANNHYQKEIIGLGLAVPLTKKFSLGASFWSRDVSYTFELEPEAIANSHKESTADLGFLWAGDNWCWAFVIEDVPVKENKTNAIGYKFGLLFGGQESIAVNLDLAYRTDSFNEYQLEFAGGIEAWILPDFGIRIGKEPGSIVTVGCGINKGRWQIDYAYKINVLGNSHFIATGFKL